MTAVPEQLFRRSTERVHQGEWQSAGIWESNAHRDDRVRERPRAAIVDRAAVQRDLIVSVRGIVKRRRAPPPAARSPLGRVRRTCERAPCGNERERDHETRADVARRVEWEHEPVADARAVADGIGDFRAEHARQQTVRRHLIVIDGCAAQTRSAKGGDGPPMSQSSRNNDTRTGQAGTSAMVLRAVPSRIPARVRSAPPAATRQTRIMAEAAAHATGIRFDMMRRDEAAECRAAECRDDDSGSNGIIDCHSIVTPEILSSARGWI